MHCSSTFLTCSSCRSRAFLLRRSKLIGRLWAVAPRTKLFGLFKLFDLLRWCRSQDITSLPCALSSPCILILRLSNTTRLFILLCFLLKTIKANVRAQFTERRSYTGAFRWRWMRFILYCSTNTPAWALLKHWLERLQKRTPDLQLCKPNRFSNIDSLCH